MKADEPKAPFNVTMNGRTRDEIRSLLRLAISIGARDRVVAH